MEMSLQSVYIIKFRNCPKYVIKFCIKSLTLMNIFHFISFLLKTVTIKQLMEYVCNFKQYFATYFGFQEAIIRQIRI
jgi:hypothetical protein